MKIIFNLFIALLLVAGFQACDDAEELLDQTFTVNIDEKIPINLSLAAKGAVTDCAPKTFAGTEILSIDNNDTHDYLNKIKSVEIKSFSYKIVEFVGPATSKITASLYVNNELLATETNLVVKTAADNGTVYTISNVDLLNKVASALKSGKSVTAKYDGTATDWCNNLSFKVQITMQVKVIANPL